MKPNRAEFYYISASVAVTLAAVQLETTRLRELVSAFLILFVLELTLALLWSATKNDTFCYIAIAAGMVALGIGSTALYGTFSRRRMLQKTINETGNDLADISGGLERSSTREGGVMDEKLLLEIRIIQNFLDSLRESK